MPSVLILGGGVAGMSAAHELSERGYQVTIVERNPILGGKARSFPAPLHGLPAEHGFRFFPTFYHHLYDTLRRIPWTNGGSVFDRLVPTPAAGIARDGHALIELRPHRPKKIQDFAEAIKIVLGNPLGVRAWQQAFFFSQVVRILTSCEERRVGEYDEICWWDFIKAEDMSPAYRTAFGHAIRAFVAADPINASTKTLGAITAWAFCHLSSPEGFDRVLDGPTSESWLDVWADQLRRLNVCWKLECTVTAIKCDRQKVTGVTVEHGGKCWTEVADHYVAALPVEDLAALVTTNLQSLDSGLKNLQKLKKSVRWMTGAQYYLREIPDLPKGHLLFADTPWALTAIAQARFWPRNQWPSIDGVAVKDCLSVCISDWFKRGDNGLTAQQCNETQILDETWSQLVKRLNAGGQTRIDPRGVIYRCLDPAITPAQPGKLACNSEKLLVNEVKTWSLRPKAVTRVPNFFLAGDYVQTHIDLATMEGANEAARAAVNGILDRDNSQEGRCMVQAVPEPSIFAAARQLDAIAYEKGRPWMLNSTLPNSIRNPKF